MAVCRRRSAPFGSVCTIRPLSLPLCECANRNCLLSKQQNVAPLQLSGSSFISINFCGGEFEPEVSLARFGSIRCGSAPTAHAIQSSRRLSSQVRTSACELIATSNWICVRVAPEMAYLRPTACGLWWRFKDRTLRPPDRVSRGCAIVAVARCSMSAGRRHHATNLLARVRICTRLNV